MNLKFSTEESVMQEEDPSCQVLDQMNWVDFTDQNAFFAEVSKLLISPVSEIGRTAQGITNSRSLETNKTIIFTK